MLKKFGRKSIIGITISLLLIGSVVLIAIADNSGISSTSSTKTDTAQEVKLTSEEIDKIIEDIKVSGNINNIIDKLDEIIKRAQLSGNDALKEYATNTKKAYELKKEYDSLNGLIEAEKKKNNDIKILDDELKKILAVKTIIEDLDGAVSNEVLILLESLSEESVGTLQTLFSEIENLVDLNDVASLSLKQRSLLDILVLDKLLNDNLLKEDHLPLALEVLNMSLTVLKTYEKDKYLESDYSKLLSESQKFAETGSKCEAAFAEQAIFFDGSFNLKHAPIMYDGHILLAIDDLYQYINATIEYMYNSPTVIIQSPGKTLEFTSGKNMAYLNDVPQNLPVPILNVHETLYMSAEFFAEAYGISYRFLKDQKTIIFYNKLNQLKNPTVPNQINRD